MDLGGGLWVRACEVEFMKISVIRVYSSPICLFAILRAIVFRPHLGFICVHLWLKREMRL
jgi:hypothetical protein